MTPERYKQVGQLYHAALELAPEERVAFLAGVCGGDEELRHEVEALLQAHERAGHYFGAPALEVAAGLLANQQASLLIGRHISHYQVLSLLGAGGMGEVYLAQDTALGRKVALKLLPARFMADADRVRRFAQEARAASALSHPNILTIFEIGEAEGTHFIATEYIDGQTLRQQIKNEAVKLNDILEVAIQVSSALAAAHEAGIVHRDIKPENLMVRRDGYVKVLDFGLAKLTQLRNAECGQRSALNWNKDAATLAQDPQANPHSAFRIPQLTAPGLVLGTIAYMSPEQVQGQEVDDRADIFSLGVVLYEMTTGRVPFAGATMAEMAAAILQTEPPPLARYAREVPAELERIVTKALAKDRANRYQGIRDLLIDLKNLKLELEVEARLKRVTLAQKQDRATAPPLGAESTTVSLPQPSSHSTALREMLEPVGGAVPLESKFYLLRPTDEKFRAAIARQDSIVLVKGARQVGKTSLLARGLQQAREAGAKVVLTDFQNLSPADLVSFEQLLLSFAASFVDQLDLDISPQQSWKADRSPGINFEQFCGARCCSKFRRRSCGGWMKLIGFSPVVLGARCSDCFAPGITNGRSIPQGRGAA